MVSLRRRHQTQPVALLVSRNNNNVLYACVNECVNIGETLVFLSIKTRIGWIGRFLPARRYASAGYRDRNVSVRLSVRHAPVLCQNEES